MAGIQKKQRYS